MKKIEILSPTGFKHNILLLFRQFHHFAKRNAFKLAMIIISIYVLNMKNISFSFNMGELGSAVAVSETKHLGSEAIPSFQKTATQSGKIKEKAEEPLAMPVDDFDREHRNPSIPSFTNTISNLGYLLNPLFSSRKKSKTHERDFYNRKCSDYVGRYNHVAQSEMKKFGIPASIILAQALLESNVGENKLARMHNNHFGIKCVSRKCSKGHCTNIEGDSHKDFYRNYESVWSAYRDHSRFLQKDRYLHLKSLGTKDYEAWAKGLMDSGYSDDESYARKLVDIIETLGLYGYDE